MLGLETSGWGPSIEAENGAWSVGLEPQADIGALRIGLVNWSLKATISALELELEPQGLEKGLEARIGAKRIGKES